MGESNIEYRFTLERTGHKMEMLGGEEKKESQEVTADASDELPNLYHRLNPRLSQHMTNHKYLHLK